MQFTSKTSKTNQAKLNILEIHSYEKWLATWVYKGHAFKYLLIKFCEAWQIFSQQLQRASMHKRYFEFPLWAPSN